MYKLPIVFTDKDAKEGRKKILEIIKKKYPDLYREMKKGIEKMKR